MSSKDYSKNWFNWLNPDKIELYPIQFANCDRIEKNDIVYIFDEVGCGKTISSGLMALHYLYNNPDKDVLVITINSLVISENNEVGQFEKDWLDKLPFEELGLRERFTVINNHYSKIENIKNKWGLVIIDEAHLFLNGETKRYTKLVEETSADKVVFLTATPIKNDIDDLEHYAELGGKITKKESNFKELKENLSGICWKFDTSSPVTRYFKDTVAAINHENFDSERATRRLNPYILQCEDKPYLDVVASHIDEQISLEETAENRFVVFVSRVEKEAVKLAEILIKKGFKEFSNTCSTENNINKTYKVITTKSAHSIGGNRKELSNYTKSTKKRCELPDVLIITYQIAEQGVNLPGYNTVINLHISSFPASLEQRFGRIDRMGKNGSVYDKINMCFPLTKEWNTNKINFLNAVAIYKQNLIPHLPAKNTILTNEMLKKTRKELRDKIDAFIQNDNLINEFLKNLHEHKTPCDKTIYRLIKDDKSKSKDKDWLIGKLTSLDLYKSVDNEDREIEKILKMGNDIFYYVDGQIEHRDAVKRPNKENSESEKGCAEIIFESKNFEDYKTCFDNEIKLPLLLKAKSFKEDLNRLYELLFTNNNVDHIFTGSEEDDKIMFTALLEKLYLDKEEIKMLENYAEKTLKKYKSDQKTQIEVQTDNYKNGRSIDIFNIIYSIPEYKEHIPFFKMCRRFGELLNYAIFECQRGGEHSKFYDNPFLYAFNEIKEECLNGNFEISEEFKKKYFLNNDNPFDFVNTELGIEPTAWYKLAYYYTRYSFNLDIDLHRYYRKSLFQYCFFTDNSKERDLIFVPNNINLCDQRFYNDFRLKNGFWLHCELVKDLQTRKRHWEHCDSEPNPNETEFFCPKHSELYDKIKHYDWRWTKSPISISEFCEGVSTRAINLFKEESQ